MLYFSKIVSFFNRNTAQTVTFSKKQPALTGFYYGCRRIEYTSLCLGRVVIIDVVYPMQTGLNWYDSKVLILNDGQDLAALDYMRTVDRHKPVVPFITLAVHAGDRMQEFGVAGRRDYLGRGAAADDYHAFLATELCTDVFDSLDLNPVRENVAIAGCSLGALSAFDFTWSHPECVSVAGCFSGSFWWRSREFGPLYSDSDRIMHEKIRESFVAPPVRIWLEAGTEDEKHDRSSRGVIDAIHDVRDLIIEMQAKGLSDDNLCYVEIPGGRHHQTTWGKAIPVFLEWAGFS